MVVVRSHLLVHDCVRYTNSSCKMNTLTHMADYISVVQVQDGVWPKVQVEDVHVVSRSQTVTPTHPSVSTLCMGRVSIES